MNLADQTQINGYSVQLSLERERYNSLATRILQDSTSMASHVFGEFCEKNEDWLSYTERLQQYFEANGTNKERRRAVLLSVVRPATYQLIRNLIISPEKPTDKSFEEIVSIVQEHRNPRPSVIVQRFNFHTRGQKEEESIADYVADLRRLADHCKFGDSLDKMLRDRLVCGIRDAPLQ